MAREDLVNYIPCDGSRHGLNTWEYLGHGAILNHYSDDKKPFLKFNNLISFRNYDLHVR